ncbi:hypothetical protein SISNIDRAFT_471284 [Sistotremastrum niveocremeum HHB9708]|uniref:Mixed lineage kinase domain-containing protein n=1 Tax=Sistotremastrum niveocremeum HHB9708 TaxID=1314777 RepID=A0A164MUN6_9AGAM|nr:hypothetical protein SISNIDRAFT_471284 [Sistotremastrum niveocremeum HHB9708]
MSSKIGAFTPPQRLSRLSAILPSPLFLSSSPSLPIPMPLAADVNANLLRSLKIVQSLGEAVPHGGVLKAIAGIGITILETAERVRLNKEECADIARRAGEDIGVLKRLDEDEELSEDLIERLERYHTVLEEVLKKVERLGDESGWKRTLRASSVQEETKGCLDRLNEAFRMYMFQFSLAADTKLTKILNRMELMSLSADSTLPADRDAPDEIRRIPTERITFFEEISCKKMRGYTIRFGNARLIDRSGHQKAVIVKKFQTMDEREDAARDAFDNETELRRDLLHASFARMLGVSIASRRTKMIVIEAGTISAYDYLQNLIGLEYFLEHTRIRLIDRRQDTDFFGNTEGRGEEGAEQQCRDVLLSATDKRLCMGGLGRMDGRWEDSGWRMEEAFFRSTEQVLREEQLMDGDGESEVVARDSDAFSVNLNADRTGGGNSSVEEYADWFERMRESLTKWSEERTDANARDLWDWLWWWSGSSKVERGTENSPTVGEIGWIDGNHWHQIPLVHHFPLADPPEYDVTASRLHDGEWETIVGTQIEGFTRWLIEVDPGEKIYLRTTVRSDRTKEVGTLFYGSALSLARDFGVDVCSLRQVSRTGFDVYACLTISNELSSTAYYFAHPPYSEGSVPEPPGFWSLCPYPVCSDCRLHADAEQVCFHVKPFVAYERINDHALSLIQDLDSHGFLPIPDIVYASDPPFATINEVSDQQAPDPIIAPHGKKRHAKDLFSMFSKKRKVSNP